MPRKFGGVWLTDDAEELIARSLRFASEPSAATAAELPSGDEVALDWPPTTNRS